MPEECGNDFRKQLNAFFCSNVTEVTQSKLRDLVHLTGKYRVTHVTLMLTNLILLHWFFITLMYMIVI